MSYKLDRSRQRLGRYILPNRRIASARKVVRQEPQPRARGAVSVRIYGANVLARFHRADRRRAGRGRSAERLVVEIKGYRGEDAKIKKLTMETYWVPGVNNSGKLGRWAFAEFTDVHTMKAEFGELIEGLRQAATTKTVVSQSRNRRLTKEY